MVLQLDSLWRVDAPFLRVRHASPPMIEIVTPDAKSMLLYGEVIRIFEHKEQYLKVQLIMDSSSLRKESEETEEFFWTSRADFEKACIAAPETEHSSHDSLILTRRWTPLHKEEEKSCAYLPMGSRVFLDNEAVIQLGRFKGFSIGEKEWLSLREISELKRVDQTEGIEVEQLTTMYRWWIVNTAKKSDRNRAIPRRRSCKFS